MALMNSIFNQGFGSQFPNMANWAQMGQRPLPVPKTPVAPTPTTLPAPAGITSVADYNTMIPLAGATPPGGGAAATPQPMRRVSPRGFLDAIRAQLAGR